MNTLGEVLGRKIRFGTKDNNLIEVFGALNAPIFATVKIRLSESKVLGDKNNTTATVKILCAY